MAVLPLGLGKYCRHYIASNFPLHSIRSTRSMQLLRVGHFMYHKVSLISRPTTQRNNLRSHVSFSFILFPDILPQQITFRKSLFFFFCSGRKGALINRTIYNVMYALHELHILLFSCVNWTDSLARTHNECNKKIQVFFTLLNRNVTRYTSFVLIMQDLKKQAITR